MRTISRRQMLASTAGIGLGILTRSSRVQAALSTASRRFTMNLNPGAIGVQADQSETIRLAAKYGFESVAPNSGELAALDDKGRDQLFALLKEQKIVWGAAGLTVEFRKDEVTFNNGLKELPKHAKALQQFGVTRVGTWLMPNHNELTYVQNFRQHARRLRECVKILNDHGLRFGMEYVGPKTLWAAARYSFIHSMAETKDLIAEIGQANVGFVLDSWHWYTAHETADDLRTLTNSDIIACDLNDAPKGLEIDQQLDQQRELPAATGVIDLKAFLGVLVEIGYDGPVRSEPFNAKLNAMDNDPACAATVAAMKKAFQLVSG